MTPEQLAARPTIRSLLAKAVDDLSMDRGVDLIELERQCEAAAIARHLAPGDDLALIKRLSKAMLYLEDGDPTSLGTEAAARIAALTATVAELQALVSASEAQRYKSCDELRARLAAMEGDAEFQEQQRRDAFARRHLSAPEDPHVYVLCERYGYGAVMDAASRLWARKDSMGAFYIGGCIGIKPSDREDRSSS